MNKIIELGVINSLKIVRETANGLYLNDLEGNEVLLPNNYVTPSMAFGDIIDVFIYTDSEDRLVATTIYPKAYKNQFALLEVVDTTSFGAFVDIGLPKDLFVPKNKQKTPFKKGEKRIIKIIEDKNSNRLIGIEKIKQFLKPIPNNLKKNDKISILIFAKTPLGFKAIVNNSYEGVLYHNEIFEPLKIGDRKTAYIKKITDDKKLDISLQPLGDAKNDILEEKILSILKSNNGTLPYSYKSDPDIIKTIFNMSKKNFKKTLTTLQEKQLIIVSNTNIKILP